MQPTEEFKAALGALHHHRAFDKLIARHQATLRTYLSDPSIEFHEGQRGSISIIVEHLPRDLAQSWGQRYPKETLEALCSQTYQLSGHNRSCKAVLAHTGLDQPSPELYHIVTQTLTGIEYDAEQILRETKETLQRLADRGDYRSMQWLQQTAARTRILKKDIQEVLIRIAQQKIRAANAAVARK